MYKGYSLVQVSIQLMSPASGDIKSMKLVLFASLVSIQLMSPASGDFSASKYLLEKEVSIQLMSPASGDGGCGILESTANVIVSIQLMSPASGDT